MSKFARKSIQTMRIQFFIRFSTRFGQSLFISGNTSALGNNDPDKALLLTYLNHEYWTGEIDADPAEAVKIQYQYIFSQQDGTRIFEGNDHKQIDISKSGVESVQVFDSWCDEGNIENVFLYRPL